MKKVISYKLGVGSFIIALLFFTHYSLLSTCSYCYAQEVISSAELIKNAKVHDGKEVVYEGEVIGELMHRQDGVWTNIYDGQHSIGVWMSQELAELIKYTGSYKAQGDIVKLQGVFNNTCSIHGGDLDIHAISLQIVKPGWQKQERMILAKRNLLIILSVILCLILISKIFIIK